MKRSKIFFSKKASEKIKLFIEKEAYIWEHNKVEIEKINHKTVSLLTLIICIGSFILSIISTFEESFYLLKIPYYILFVVSIPLVFLSKSEKRRVSSLGLLYFTHTIIMLFSVYGGCVVVPDTESTLVLGFVFVFSLTVFDKIKRVNLVMLLFLSLYVLVATPMKAPDVVVMDSINVLGFSVVAMILGGSLRQLQLDNIDLRRQSRIRESTDALTGLFNRAKLLKLSNKPHVVQELAAIIMIDIDYFKAYNDHYGHQQGDYCLQSVSNIFQEMTHQYKMDFYRYGGEEFLGVVSKDEKEDPLTICQNVSEKVQALHINHQKSPFKCVTISVGCSLVDDGAEKTFENLISQADEALYFAKNTGRNRVDLYGVMDK